MVRMILQRVEEYWTRISASKDKGSYSRPALDLHFNAVHGADGVRMMSFQVQASSEKKINF